MIGQSRVPLYFLPLHTWNSNEGAGKGKRQKQINIEIGVEDFSSFHPQTSKAQFCLLYLFNVPVNTPIYPKQPIKKKRHKFTQNIPKYHMGWRNVRPHEKILNVEAFWYIIMVLISSISLLEKNKHMFEYRLEWEYLPCF